MKRALLLVVLALALVATPAAAVQPASAHTAADETALTALSLQENETAANETTHRPATAEVVRVLPVQLQEDFVSVETAEAGARYNTSGPFAFFSTSEPVAQAAIQQPGATATVLEGGRTIKVEYADEAAPVGKQSLYRLELYFADDSRKEVELLASDTAISTGNADLNKYRPFILDVLDDAEDAGYERDAEGAESHYADVQEDAQLLNNLFGEYAKRLFGSILSILWNPLGIASLLAGIALIARWALSSNRNALEIISNDSGKFARLRERMWIQYKKSQQTAAEEPLSEVVGEMNEIYWSDAFGVDTTAGLAELFRTGMPVRRNGETQHVGGVDELDAETIHSSWIEVVCREHRIASPEIALSDGKRALHRMVKNYGMGHIYGASYRQVCELIDELDETRDLSSHSATSFDSQYGGAGAAGGDD